MKIVIALGGNAIQSGDGTAKAQQQALKKTAAQLADIIKEGHQISITHGNGPQVGNILLQQGNANSAKTPAMPLDTCGAMSEGMIGYWLANEVSMKLKKQDQLKGVTALITRVEVDPNDIAFTNPTKPIGPFYTEEKARKLMKEMNNIYEEDAGRGWRKVVPSPKPVNIIEHQAIKTLMDNGYVVISTGGGGIPVYDDGDEMVGLEAVIDKDFASETLAELIDADVLMILTEVENVFLNFNKQNQEALSEVSTEQLRAFIKQGHFAQGSMLPKVEAAITFADSKLGRQAIITSLSDALEALKGRKGTLITKRV